MRDRPLVKNEIEEIEVRLIGVRGCALVRVERWRTTNATGSKVKERVEEKLWMFLPVVGIGGGVCQTDGVLYV